MDNRIDLHKSMDLEFGNKYSHTYANGNVYYHWNESNDKKLNGPGFNWNGYLDIPEPIDFESTKRPTGKTEKVEFPAAKKYGIEKKIIEFPQSEPTGYLVPRFKFINAQFYRYDYKGDEYKQALNTFGINENGTIPPEKIPIVSNYRDTYLKQLYRQANKLNEFNSEIANVLKVYYYESEQAITKRLSITNKEVEKVRISKDWKNVLQDIRNLFEALILTGAKTELIKGHSMLKKLRMNTYVSEHLINTTIHGILTISKKKDPIINMAVQIAGKINPMESILEDAFLNDRIKSKNQFEQDERFKQLPEPVNVANQFYHRKENKAGIYKPEIIEVALSIVRKYIFENKITSLDRKVRTISDEVKKQSESLEETDPKTIDEWVKFYWNQYKPTD